MAGGVGYSRLVAWLKILLPLAALALLSTLFLFSRNVDPVNSIPFSQVDLEERVREQQLTQPSFSGSTARGDLIRFTASAVRPDTDTPGRATADAPQARIDLVGGTVIEFHAKSGEMDQPGDLARLKGDAVLTSSTGYTVQTEELTAGIETIRAETPGAVEGTGPAGRFTAGKMVLTTDPGTGDAHLLFTGGVHLVYEPGN